MKRKKKTNNEDDDDNGFAAWGGYMNAKKSKLLDQFKDKAKLEANKASDLFHGISIFVNGYTRPSADELKQLMSVHGGIYHHYHISSRTTYIIASNLPDTKIKNMGPNQKILKPEWITDCIAANKLLDYSDYLLYTNCNRKQPRLNFEKINKNISNFEDKTTKELTSDTEIACPMSPDIFLSFEDDEINKLETGNNQNDAKTVNEIIETCENTEANNEVSLPALEVKNNSVVNSIGHKFENSTVVVTDSNVLDKTNNRTRTANDPKFLAEFYNNSRLHHISTLGATFKQHICNLREQSTFKFPEIEKLKDYLLNLKDRPCRPSIKNPVIMHIDMDCFFVSVGLRKRPELRGKPVAVTHSKGGQEPTHRPGVDRQAELDIYMQRVQDRMKTKSTNSTESGNVLKRFEAVENSSMSEIASCSYEARKAGVKNGMFMGPALKLCSNLQTIPYDFDGYKEVAYTLYNTIAEYTLNIEAVSCDEMFVDISDLLHNSGATVLEWASYIRSLIQTRTGCPCSTGFGTNRLQARMATRTAKPNGQFYLLPEAVEEYMVDIRVDDLPGVGRSTTLKLASLGIKTCGDLQQMTLTQLQTEFGTKIGESLYQHCRGIDNRSLVYEHERKSVSAEVNYGIRFKNNTEADTFFKQLATEVHSRLVEIKMKGKCITLKLMVRSKNAPAESSKFMGHGICDYINKSTTLSTAVDDLNIITREVLLLVQKLSVPPTELRGIGIQISRLEKSNKTQKPSVLTKFLINPSTRDKPENKPQQDISRNNAKNGEILANIPSTSSASVRVEQTDDVTKSISSRRIYKSNSLNNINETKKEQSVITSKGKSSVNKLPSPVKKGRGRPRGGRGGKTLRRVKSNNSIMERFLVPPSNIQDTILIDGIDLDVWSALPQDIQQELVRDYKLTNTDIRNINVNPPVPIDINEDIDGIPLNENSSDGFTAVARTEIVETTNIVEPIEPTEKCMFSGLNLKQLRTLIENWVTSADTPEQCDVKMLGKYFRKLALEQKQFDLFQILKFLHSEILFKDSCDWHQAYFEVVTLAQEGMYAAYKSKIWVYEEFPCKHHCCLAQI